MIPHDAGPKNLQLFGIMLWSRFDKKKRASGGAGTRRLTG
ncbi:protein of unknown function [Methylocella tundrae]|uniref:Uncharacterized protein n=1 Tax=Methylocella tundrae TaxID=227605 RepID=A0A4U8YZA8_METTU|nr:protein of unknown function [Methylocella tundrae]